MLPDGSRKAQSRGPQRLVDGLLEHLGAGRADGLERGVEVVGAEHEHGQDALGEQLLERVAVGLRAAGVRLGEHDAQAGLGVAAERDPAVVRPRRRRCAPRGRARRGRRRCDSSTSLTVMLQYWSEMVMTATLGGGRRAPLLESCSVLARPAGCAPSRRRRGIASTRGAPGRGTRSGVSPTISVNRELNEPSEVQPTAMQASVTLIAAAQQRHGPLDPAGHQVAVRRLAVGGPELPREVRRRHEGAARPWWGRRAAGRTRGRSGPAPGAARPRSCRRIVGRSQDLRNSGVHTWGIHDRRDRRRRRTDRHDAGGRAAAARRARARAGEGGRADRGRPLARPARAQHRGDGPARAAGPVPRTRQAVPARRLLRRHRQARARRGWTPRTRTSSASRSPSPTACWPSTPPRSAPRSGAAASWSG